MRAQAREVNKVLDPAKDLINWLDARGEIDTFEGETSTVPGERSTGSDLYTADIIENESRAGIDLDQLGRGDGLGIQLDSETRDQISNALGKKGTVIKAPNHHVLAWYQPIHYYGSDWGIFINTQGLLEVTEDIATYVSAREVNLEEKLVLASFSILYYHELFHHRVESAAIRMHVIEDKPCYRAYTKKIYSLYHQLQTSCPEEKMAMADMFRKIDSSDRWKIVGKNIRRATKEYLLDLFKVMPPTYMGAETVIKSHHNQQALGELLSSIQEISTKPLRSADEWRFASNISKPLYTISQNIWEITSPGIAPVMPHSFPLSVTRKKIENALKSRGFTEVPSAGKGSHTKWKGPNGEMTTLPKGKEIFGSTVHNIAQTLNINVREFDHY